MRAHGKGLVKNGLIVLPSSHFLQLLRHWTVAQSDPSQEHNH
jgi:hypothetical protein